MHGHGHINVRTRVYVCVRACTHVHIYTYVRCVLLPVVEVVIAHHVAVDVHLLEEGLAAWSHMCMGLACAPVRIPYTHMYVYMHMRPSRRISSTDA